MQEILNQLVNLQKMDNRIAEIKKIITNIPEQMRVLKEKLAKAEQGYKTISEELESNKKSYSALDIELKEKKELLDNSQKKLVSVQNNKEYESVLRELDALKKNVIEGDAALTEMTNTNFKYESELASIIELKKELEKQLGELNNSKVDEDKELQNELDKLLADREKFVASIKPGILSKYERIRAHRNNIGIASVEDEVCNGCYMRIPPQLYVDVKKDKAVYSCPHCQRILYYIKTEEEGNK